MHGGETKHKRLREEQILLLTLVKVSGWKLLTAENIVKG